MTVADICAAAEIAPRTFHRYFLGKEDVLAEPVRQMSRIALDAIDSAPPDADDGAALAHGMRAGARFVVENRDWIRGLRIVTAQSPHLRAASIALRPDQEGDLVAQLRARRSGAAGPAGAAGAEPGWLLRLRVATSVAAFRVWLDDYFREEPADPPGRLEEILRASGLTR